MPEIRSREVGGEKWRVWDDELVEPTASGLKRDSELVAGVGAGNYPPTARLWTSPQAVVVPNPDSRLPQFSRAAEHSRGQGWPIAVRETGGSAFPVGPGVVNLSLAFRKNESDNIHSVYRFLCAPIQDALAEFGIESTVGRARSAFCEGEFDILGNGFKLVGTSQSWKIGGCIIAHAGILVAGDTRERIEAVRWYYLLTGRNVNLEQGAVSTVAALLDVRGEDEQVLVRRFRQSLHRAICRRFGIGQQLPSQIAFA